MNRTSESRSYVLLSDSGTALVIDYGYDLTPGIPIGGPRSAVRPWLPALAALRRDYGIEKVEVAIPTHYHDDHVAAFNLLREVEGTEVWAVSRSLRCWSGRGTTTCRACGTSRSGASGTYRTPAVRWREYELSIHDLPGHTLYASAIAFKADGRRVLATGDQQDGGWRPGEQAEIPNFQYANGFEPDDYARSAALYQRLEPELMISGHWAPRVVTRTTWTCWPSWASGWRRCIAGCCRWTSDWDGSAPGSRRTGSPRRQATGHGHRRVGQPVRSAGDRVGAARGAARLAMSPPVQQRDRQAGSGSHWSSSSSR